MTLYAWTITMAGRKNVKHVSSVTELNDCLRVLELPGLASPERMTVELQASEHGVYTYGQGTVDEWSLTWAKVDGATEVMD